MLKNVLPLLFAVLLVVGCKNGNKEDKKMDNEVSANFNEVLSNYYEEGLKLNPINATFEGDTRYNNTFPNFLSDEYTAELKSYYESYKNKISTFKDEDLSETEKMSKDVLLWECNINLETLSFKNRLYFPIDQMWSVNLVMGQLASGSSAQPFKTVADYNNWLQRVDGFVIWLNSAKERMAEGAKQGYVLPKALIAKVSPQLKEMTNPNLDENLFYSPIKNFPDSFSEEEKQQFTEAYSKMVSEKVIPAYKNLHEFYAGEYSKSGRESTGIARYPQWC